jgi:phage shock protein A
MFARMRRIFRSFVGLFISMAENPELIIEQNLRDMRDKIPEMNTGIAKARGGIIMLEQESQKYKEDVGRLTAKIKASLMGGEEGLAGQLAVQLQKVKEALERNQAQLQSAQQGYDALLKLKDKFMREVKIKTEEAQRALGEARAAKWKGELADVFQQFEVAGVDATHDEMMDKLKEKSATAEGKLAMAVESMDMKSIEIEEKAQVLEGQELLKQFKLDLGMVSVAPDFEPSKTVGHREPVQKRIEG